MAPIVLTKLLRLSQITGGYIGTEDGPIAVSGAKYGLLANTLEEILSGNRKKVVIFCRFLPEVDGAVELANSLGFPAVRLVGAQTAQQRWTAWHDQFQEDERTRVIVCQIATGGEGIELFRASDAIFYSWDYSYGLYEQAKCRLHRPGQVNKVTYHHLMMKDTIDEVVFEAIQSKRSIAELIIDKLRSRHPSDDGTPSA